VIDLGAAVNQYSFYLRNSTASNLVVTARLVASETPPPGQAAIVGSPPVLVRGNLNSTNLTYAYTDLSGGGTVSWTLKPKGQPGSEIPVIIGVNRTAMTAPAGSLYAGILRFTDALNFSQIDVPVSAQSSSATGLWMGKALVSQVGNYLKTYQLDANNRPVMSSDGNYIVTGISTNLGPVPQAFPQRLILHNDGTNVFLLQRIFYGLNQSSNIVVATQESALDPARLDTARRISAANFPWSNTNLPWTVSGQLVPGGNLTATVQLAYDDQASNPFLHTYHPDHDNLDGGALPLPTKLPQGSESYGITRAIKLNLDPPGNDFVSRTTAGQSLIGTYSELITVTGLGGATRNFNVSGVVVLTRISTIATLTRL
jgi:hypothetical protein